MSDGRIPLADALRKQLSDAVGPVGFSDLRAHLDRDAVFVVASSIDLVECGVKVAMDDVDVVRAWIESGALRKPTRDERAAWRDVGGVFRTVIVQPFVLVQIEVAAGAA